MNWDFMAISEFQNWEQTGVCETAG